MITRAHILILCSLFIYGCSHNSDDGKSRTLDGGSQKSLISKGVIRLPLDSLTGFSHLSFSIDSIKGVGDVLSFINSQSNSLYLYSLEKEDIIRVHTFQKDGPEGVGSLSVAGHLVHTLDSIFIYGINYGTLFLFDEETNLIEKFKIVDFNDTEVQIIPQPIGLAKIRIIGQEMYFPSTLARRLNDYSNTPSQTVFNLKTGDIDYRFNFSPIYSQAYWGNTFKYMSTIVSDGKNVIVNFPIDENIQVYNIEKDKISEVKMGSNYISKFTPMDEDIDFGMRPKDNSFYKAQDNYSFSNSEFAGLLYDEYRDLYYRLVYVRPPLEEVRKGEMVANLSIITFDNEFRKLSETLLEKDKYDPSMMGVSKEGLLIARKDIYANDENGLSLEIFGLQ